jgi:hypothetical protein
MLDAARQPTIWRKSASSLCAVQSRLTRPGAHVLSGPWTVVGPRTQNGPIPVGSGPFLCGADERDRTVDLHLGKKVDPPCLPNTRTSQGEA